MQHITLLCVGKLSERFFADGVAEYAKRLGALCQFDVVEISEEAINEKNASAATEAKALEKEGARLLAALPKGAKLVALCVEGQQKPSPGLAAYLREAALSGQGDVAFAIGSSHGLCDAVKQRADLRLSLSEMTLPHQMARLVLTEQIYRAFMIQNGGKYHK